MARISTHVLDTSLGLPAEGMLIELTTSKRELIASAITNADGRTERPLLSLPEIPTGPHQLLFYAGEYFRKLKAPLTDPPFLDVIVIRFGISDPLGNYHVPLLVSPYGYSTYRGS